MTKLAIDPNFASSLAALNIGGMIPNPISDRYNLDTSNLEPPGYIVNYGIKSALFFANSLTFLGTSAAILLAYLPIYLLSKVKIQFVAKYFQSKLHGLKWNVPLQLWLTAYLDLGIFSLLQLRNAAESFGSLIGVASFIVAAVFAIGTVITPVVLSIFYVKQCNKIENRSDEHFNKKFGVLFLPFKTDKKYSGFAYYLIFTIRRLFLAISLVLLPDMLTFSAVINTSLSLTVTSTQTFLYLLLYRPFISRMDQIEAIAIEGCTVAIYTLASSFNFHFSSAAQSVLGKAGAWAVLASIGVNSGLSLVRSVVIVAGLVEAYKERRKIMQSRYRVVSVDSPFADNGRQIVT